MLRSIDSTHVWAASYNMLWNKVYAMQGQALFFGPRQKKRGKVLLPPGASLFLSVEKVRTTHQLIQCSVCDRDDTDSVWSFVVDRPFKFKSSIDYFREQWDKVAGGEVLAAFSVGFTNLRIQADESSGQQRGQIIAEFQRTKYGNDIDCSKLFEIAQKGNNHSSSSSSAKEDVKKAGNKLMSAKTAEAGEEGEEDAEEDDDDDDDNMGFGLDLLTQEFSSCTGTDSGKPAESEAVQASMEEANGTFEVEGLFTEASDTAMAQTIAQLVDEDLKIMENFESMILQKAVDQKSIKPEEIATSISKLCQEEGLDVEDAVVEAALNSSKLLGNDIPRTIEENVTETETVTADGNTPDCLSSYASSIRESVSSLLKCLRSLSSGNVGYNLSLACSPSDVSGMPSFASSRRIILIHWEIPGKTGRVARVDEDGKLVSMVCVGANQYSRNLESCTLIDADIGMRMERIKKKDRPRLPPHALRVVNMFLQDEQLMLTQQEDELRQNELNELQWQNVLDLSDGEYCAYCRSGHAAEGPPPLRCPLCLLSLHDHCADEFAKVHRDSILKIYSEESSGSCSTLTEAQEP